MIQFDKVLEQNEVVSKDVLEQKYKDVIDITADIE